MKKFVVRTVLLLLVLGLVFGGLAYYRLHGVPDWYDGTRFSPAQLAEAKRSIQDKAVVLNNFIVDPKMRGTVEPASSADNASEPPEPQTAETMTVSFTAAELQYILNEYEDQLDEYFGHIAKYPRLAIEDNRLKIGAYVPSVDIVVSMWFTADRTESDQLFVRLDSVRAGRLPIPQSTFGSRRDRAIAALKTDLPEMQQEVALDAQNGTANDAAVYAQLRLIALAFLQERAFEPLAFMPNSLIPVRIERFELGQDEVTLEVRPLQPEEMAAAEEAIRSFPLGDEGDAVETEVGDDADVASEGAGENKTAPDRVSVGGGAFLP